MISAYWQAYILQKTNKKRRRKLPRRLAPPLSCSAIRVIMHRSCPGESEAEDGVDSHCELVIF
jgi:hypothetical protein